MIHRIHMNPRPFHSPALKYITLQVAKSSPAVLEGDIDPNDLWGRPESLTNFFWILWWFYDGFED